VVVVALAWGTWRVADADVALRAAPLSGRWRWHGDAGLVPAMVVAVVVVGWGPGLARRLAARRLPVVAGGAATVWSLALAASDGWDGVAAPLTTRHEYEPFAAGVRDIGGFLERFVDDLASAPVHIQGHPPGPVVLAWALDRVGLGGAGWLAAAALAGWGVAVGAAVVAARYVAGAAAARRAAPALALVPAALWAGTSVDAIFAGLAGVAVALVAVAGHRARRAAPAAREAVLAAAAGVVSGVALVSTYGALLVVGIAGAVVAVCAPPGRRGPLLAALAAGTAAVLLAAGAAGFWWPDGLAATGERYWAGVGSDRPALYTTVVGNPAALALAAGPAVAAGLATIRRSRTAMLSLDRAQLLPVLALVAIVAADVSQMSRGEVERIWLPFVPWLALAAPGDRRRWLAAQAVVALVLESALVSPW
jgi:hypothetical protein